MIPTWGLSCLHVLPAPAWVLSAFSGLLPQSKHRKVRSIGNSKKVWVWMAACSRGLCDTLATCRGFPSSPWGSWERLQLSPSDPSGRISSGRKWIGGWTGTHFNPVLMLCFVCFMCDELLSLTSFQFVVEKLVEEEEDLGQHYPCRRLAHHAISVLHWSEVMKVCDLEHSYLFIHKIHIFFIEFVKASLENKKYLLGVLK